MNVPPLHILTLFASLQRRKWNIFCVNYLNVVSISTNKLPGFYTDLYWKYNVIVENVKFITIFKLNIQERNIKLASYGFVNNYNKPRRTGSVQHAKDNSVWCMARTAFLRVAAHTGPRLTDRTSTLFIRQRTSVSRAVVKRT